MALNHFNRLTSKPCIQDFDYFVVIDFEATCDQERIPNPQEIIEFPSVIVSGITGEMKAKFQTYVRPIYHPLLTPFCKELTGIQQYQVDRGISLAEALFFHDKWLSEMGIINTKFAVVTWSNWDCHQMLESECSFKNIRKPHYFNQWINLRLPFKNVFGDVRCNLKEAVEYAGLMWYGRVHSGLDDAINISRLLSVIMKKGFKFFITMSLTPPQVTPNNALTWLMRIPQNPEEFRLCDCGAKSIKKMILKDGPKKRCFFFGCGNWTPNRGACCNFFQWVDT